MPAARRRTKTTQDPQEISVALPKFNRGFYGPLMVILLVIAAFLLGDFYAQLNYLKGNKGLFGLGSASQNTPTGSTNTTPAPTSGPVVANVGNGHLPVKGKDSAKITIVEFADLRCPFCKEFFDNVESQLFKDYVDTGKVKFYFRQWPFLDPSPSNPASTLAANAAECANDQGFFWQMHDYLYQNQPAETDTSMYTVDNLTTIAGGLGMDSGQFNICLSAKSDSSKVSQDYSDGQKAGVSGTPTFFINGIQIVGAVPYKSFQDAIACVEKNQKFVSDSQGNVTCSQ